MAVIQRSEKRIYTVNLRDETTTKIRPIVPRNRRLNVRYRKYCTKWLTKSGSGWRKTT